MKVLYLFFVWFIINGYFGTLVFTFGEVPSGFTPHFRSWLAENGYSEWNFTRLDISNATFGGKESANETIENTPVIFFHGNSDIGF
jgi:hypothetical protein